MRSPPRASAASASWLGALPLVFLEGTQEIRLIAGAALFLALVSLVDDVKSLPVAVRLPCHLAAAAWAVVVAWPGAQARAPSRSPSPWPRVLAIAWMTNLFNFMDGADGLAGGMALIGFGSLAFAAMRGGDAALANASLALAAAAAGFLVFNFPPARVFMGDAGSVPLGFLAGALGWLGAVRDAWPGVVPLAGVLPVHRRCHGDPRAAGGGIGAVPAGAPDPLLPAAGPGRLEPPEARRGGLGPDGGSQCERHRRAGAAPRRARAIIFAWAVAYVALLVAVDRRNARASP